MNCVRRSEAPRRRLRGEERATVGLNLPRPVTEGRLLAMAAPLLEEIRKLSIAERLELVEDVWDSIAAEADALPVPESHRRALARRRQEHRDHPEDVIPWEEVRKQLWSEE